MLFDISKIKNTTLRPIQIYQIIAIKFQLIMNIICRQWEHQREMFLKLHTIKNVLVYFIR